MRTQWGSKRDVGGCPRELSEREKEIELNDAAEDGEELIYCASGVTDGEVRYNEDRGVLSFYAASNNGNMGGWLTTDDFTTETLVNIINALDSILDKRREIPKMAKKFEDLQSYMTWACGYILKADENCLQQRVNNVMSGLCNAYGDLKISACEAAQAANTATAVLFLRREMLKDGRLG